MKGDKTLLLRLSPEDHYELRQLIMDWITEWEESENHPDYIKSMVDKWKNIHERISQVEHIDISSVSDEGSDPGTQMEGVSDEGSVPEAETQGDSPGVEKTIGITEDYYGSAREQDVEGVKKSVINQKDQEVKE